jgi:dolichol-phosphate mannosyltransferase
MVILYLVVHFTGLNHLVAAAIASEISVLTNFAMNDRWTFGDRTGGSSWMRRAAQYNGVALTGMAISLTTMAALMWSLGMHYLLANFVALTTATVSNYLLNSRITWAADTVSQPAIRTMQTSMQTQFDRYGLAAEPIAIEG